MISPKPRLLIVISYSFSIRYIIRSGLLQTIQSFATPVVIVTWQQHDLLAELAAAGIEVHVAEPPVLDVAYYNVRRKINYWFQHFRLRYPSRTIQEKYLDLYRPAKQRYLKKCIALFNTFKLYIPGYTARLMKQEKALLQAEPAFLATVKWIKSLQATAVFTLTPFHTQEDVLLQACAACQLRMLTSILSFDNITKRGWIPVAYDVYMVWNAYNKEELHTIYPYTKNKKVLITGAPQFDFYTKKEWLYEVEAWRSMTGLAGMEKRKIILYAGGPKELFPEEPIYLQHISEAIQNNEIKGNPVVLFRCHPVDNIERWKKAIGNAENIIFESSWSGSEKLHLANITEHDIKKLCSALCHTDVHVNVCSTMTLDGTMWGKPQVGPAYLHTRRSSRLLKNMYYQKHFEPICAGGGIALATSKESLIEEINKALSTPPRSNNTMLEQMITFTDGNSTARVAAALKESLQPLISQNTESKACPHLF